MKRALLLGITATSALIAAQSPAFAEECVLGRSEKALIDRAFQALPSAYDPLRESVTFRKDCTPAQRVERANGASYRLARTRGQEITLFADLFRAKNQRFILSIIAHELTHALDDREGLSHDRSFREVNAWRNKFGIFPPKQDERMAEGSFREQGERNPEEDLGTAAEGYFFRADFACEHPAMYAWFMDHVGPTRMPFPVSCPGLAGPVDPARTTGVSYVYAASYGKRIESRWGHAALLIKNDTPAFDDDMFIEAIGNEKGQPLLTGYEKDGELQAKISELLEDQKDSSRVTYLIHGLTGGMDLRVKESRYELYYFLTVMQEGRDITELPLPLAGRKLKLFAWMINAAVKDETHGAYSLFSNNCATVVARYINLALARRVITPGTAGIYFPNQILEQVRDATGATPETTYGYQHYFEETREKREAAVAALRKSPRFAGLSFKALASKKMDEKKIQLELAAIKNAVESSAGWDAATLAQVRTLAFSFGFSRDFKLQALTQDLYQVAYSKSP